MPRRKVMIGGPPEADTQVLRLTVDEAQSAVFLVFIGALAAALATGAWTFMLLPIILIVLYTINSD